MNSPINILCATDDAYLPYCGIMLTSLFESNKNNSFHVYIICNSLSSKGQKDLEFLGEQYSNIIYFINIDSKLVENFPIKERDHVSLATYYRLFAPVILPKDMDRILYLDCDMIIDGPINSMYHDDIGNAALACVLDEDYMSEKKYDRLDLEYTRTYFNAGMLLINLDYWRRHNVYERCMECISRIPEKLILHDQDTLNVVLKDEVKHIPMKYNMQTAFLYTKTRLEDSVREELLETLDTPVIIHYTGSRKPWLRHYYHPYLDHFRHYLGISRWKDIPLTKIFKEEWRYWRHTIKFALKIKKYPFIIKTVNRKR